MLRVSPGSTTTDPAARGDPGPDQSRLGGPNRIEQFGTGNEHHAGAHYREQYARIAGIGFHIMAPTLDRADRNRINHQERLEAGLDDEQSGETL